MTATAVTTRTATMHEDLEKNQKTSQVCANYQFDEWLYPFIHRFLFYKLCFNGNVIQQVEEKTVAHTTATSATRQEQRVVTQEVRTTSHVLSGEQVKSSRLRLFTSDWEIFVHGHSQSKTLNCSEWFIKCSLIIISG